MISVVVKQGLCALLIGVCACAEPFVWQVEPTKAELANKLNTATRSMEHMNSLLHESEATNAILMEQINVRNILLLWPLYNTVTLHVYVCNILGQHKCACMYHVQDSHSASSCSES